jgi:hypothetical protein
MRDERYAKTYIRAVLPHNTFRCLAPFNPIFGGLLLKSSVSTLNGKCLSDTIIAIDVFFS